MDDVSFLSMNGDLFSPFRKLLNISTISVSTICRISNVLLCNVTDRVSFWFVVTDSSKNTTTVPGSEVEAAIRYSC